MDEYQIVIKNLFDVYRKASEIFQYKLIEQLSYHYIISPNGSWPNMVFNIDNQIVESDLNQLVDGMKSQLLPSRLILTSNNETVSKYLINNGIRPVMRWDAMLLKSGYTKSTISISASPNIKVETVTTLAQFELWTLIVNQSLSQNLAADKMMLLTNNINLITCSIAYYDGIPAGTLMSYDNGESIGLYFIATLPELRGKGVASALVSHSLVKALEQNEKSIILHATAAGKLVYLKFGFETVGLIDIYWTVGKKYC